MAKQYGKVGWDDESQKRGRFLKLIKGSNVVRFICDPYKYKVHTIKFEGDTNKFGRKIKCAINDCHLCADGTDTGYKYIVGALVDDKVKFIDMGPGLYSKIKGMKKHISGFENPLEYNINIVVDPDGGAQNYYQAYPMQKTELTANQMAIIEDEFDENELEEYASPPSPEGVIQNMESIKRWLNKDRDAKKGSREKTVKEETEVSDDDYNFHVKRN